MWLICVLGEGDKLQNRKEEGASGVQASGSCGTKIPSKFLPFFTLKPWRKANAISFEKNREKLSVSLAEFGSPPVYPTSFIIISSTLQFEHFITYHSELPSQTDSLSLPKLCLLSTLQTSAGAS